MAATASEKRARVWAIDAAHAPSYWFPRNCPRACCWRGSAPVSAAGRVLLGSPEAQRLHAVEAGWLERVRACRLFVYRFDPAPFVAQDEIAGYWIARESVRPTSVEPVGDLVALHARAGIELRVVDALWPVIDAILESGLEFSIIRSANARPRIG